MTFSQENADRFLSQEIYHFRNHFQNSKSKINYPYILLSDIFHHGKIQNPQCLFLHAVQIFMRDVSHDIDNHKA
jgi:hypothetical protein